MPHPKSTYNTRYIVFIQTKYHQNILPENDVSPHSLDTLLKTIKSHRWWVFRSIRVYREDITTLRVYEMNFINYKQNVLKLSENWKNIYKNLNYISYILDFILYHFIYKPEINKFWKTITNSKPKYLIDKTDGFNETLYWKDREYIKNKYWKEVIETVDFHNWKLYINEKAFTLKDSDKSSYFLDLLTDYFSKHEEDYFLELYEYIDFYEKRCYDDWKDYDYLTLSVDNVKKSYIQTINKAILEKYDKEILEMKKGFIQIIQDSK